MSFEGQVLCQRMLIEPWALTTLGAATAVAVALAASMKRRRVAVLDDDFSDIRLPPRPLSAASLAAFLVNRWSQWVFPRRWRAVWPDRRHSASERLSVELSRCQSARRCARIP